MKKVLGWLLIFVLLFSFTACDNSNTKDNDNKSKEEFGYKLERELDELELLEWHKYDNAKQIPIPKSSMADMENVNDVRFDFYLTDMSFEEYTNYVQQCKEKGFTIDAIEQEYKYYAFNEGKYELTVQYYQGNIMYVCVVEERFEVDIKLNHVDAVSANMYNLRIEIDGYWEEDAESGKETIGFDSYLKEGPHTLIVEDDDNDDVSGRIDFTVTKDGEYIEFEIKCTNNKIEISQVQN